MIADRSFSSTQRFSGFERRYVSKFEPNTAATDKAVW